MKLRKNGTVLAVLAAGAMFSARERAAVAAPAPQCTPATMQPRATTIPVNLPGFGYDAQRATAMNVRLTTTSGTTQSVPVTIGSVVDGLLQVTATLTPGVSYSLDFDSMCNFGAVQPEGPIRFTAAPAAPLPTKIGDFKGTPAITVMDFGTSEFSINAGFTIADEMKPWEGVYDFNVTLDGKPVPTKLLPELDGVTFNGQGWCDTDQAAKPMHTITLQAHLPFAPDLETAPIQASFACPAPNIHTPAPSNPTTTNDPTSPTPTTVPTAIATPGPSPSGSHGCSVGPTGAGAPVAPVVPLTFAALGLALVLVRRPSCRTVASSRKDS
jgi:hypothetical protein